MPAEGETPVFLVGIGRGEIEDPDFPEVGVNGPLEVARGGKPEV